MGGCSAYSSTNRIVAHWGGIDPLKQLRLRSLHDKKYSVSVFSWLKTTVDCRVLAMVVLLLGFNSIIPWKQQNSPWQWQEPYQRVLYPQYHNYHSFCFAYNIVRWRSFENSGGTPPEIFWAFKALHCYAQQIRAAGERCFSST